MRWGDARLLVERDAPYDLLFVDGAGYAADGEGFAGLLDLLRPGGQVVVDDVTPIAALPADSPFRESDPKREAFARAPNLAWVEVVAPDLAGSCLVGTRVGGRDRVDRRPRSFDCRSARGDDWPSTARRASTASSTPGSDRTGRGSIRTDRSTPSSPVGGCSQITRLGSPADRVDVGERLVPPAERRRHGGVPLEVPSGPGGVGLLAAPELVDARIAVEHQVGEPEVAAVDVVSGLLDRRPPRRLGDQPATRSA